MNRNVYDHKRYLREVAGEAPTIDDYALASSLPSGHTFQRHVLNPLFQNIWAGIGLTLVVKFVPKLWEYEPDNETALICGIALFGVLCVFRFSQDEIASIISSVVVKVYDLKLSHDNTATIDYYEATIEHHLATIKDLKAQLEMFGGAQVGNPLTLVEVAERKTLAIKLYNRLVDQLPITRDECLRLKVFESRTDWQKARQFLIDAGVMQANGTVLPSAVTKGLALIESYAQTLIEVRVKLQ